MSPGRPFRSLALPVRSAHLAFPESFISATIISYSEGILDPSETYACDRDEHRIAALRDAAGEPLRPPRRAPPRHPTHRFPTRSHRLPAPRPRTARLGQEPPARRPPGPLCGVPRRRAPRRRRLADPTG